MNRKRRGNRQWNGKGRGRGSHSIPCTTASPKPTLKRRTIYEVGPECWVSFPFSTTLNPCSSYFVVANHKKLRTSCCRWVSSIQPIHWSTRRILVRTHGEGKLGYFASEYLAQEKLTRDDAATELESISDVAQLHNIVSVERTPYPNHSTVFED